MSQGAQHSGIGEEVSFYGAGEVDSSYLDYVTSLSAVNLAMETGDYLFGYESAVNTLGNLAHLHHYAQREVGNFQGHDAATSYLLTCMTPAMVAQIGTSYDHLLIDDGR